MFVTKFVEKNVCETFLSTQGSGGEREQRHCSCSSCGGSGQRGISGRPGQLLPRGDAQEAEEEAAARTTASRATDGGADATAKQSGASQTAAAAAAGTDTRVPIAGALASHSLRGFVLRLQTWRQPARGREGQAAAFQHHAPPSAASAPASARRRAARVRRQRRRPPVPHHAQEGQSQEQVSVLPASQLLLLQGDPASAATVQGCSLRTRGQGQNGGCCG